MELVIPCEKTKTFLALFESLNSLTQTTTLTLGENGLEIQTIDESHVALLSLHIKPSFFQNYKGESKQIGLFLPSFIKILKVLSKEETWSVHIEENKIQIAGESDKHFSLPLLSLDEDPLQMSELEYAYSPLNFQTNELKTLVKELLIHNAEEIILQNSEEKLYLKSQSNQGDCLIKLSQTKFTDEIKLAYSAEFFSKFVCNVSTQVSLYFDTENPLCVKYKEADFQLAFYLASKISEE